MAGYDLLMLFQKRFWAGIVDGSITLTFRRWDRPRVIAGRPYRTGGGRVEVLSVSEVEADEITDSDAERSGHESADALVADLPGVEVNPIYRIEFRLIDEPDPREVLAADADLAEGDIAEISRRLTRLDKASKRGPWTMTVLELVERHPATRAPDLAVSLGLETLPFKTDVRKLKNLGLTYSLNPGYRLSPRGAAYLEAVRKR